MEKIKHNDIKFIFKNIGAIEYAEVPLNDLTMIVGKNSTSKTYLTYIIWGFLDFINTDNMHFFVNNYIKDIIDSDGTIKNEINMTKFVKEHISSLILDISSFYKTNEVHKVIVLPNESLFPNGFDFGVDVANIHIDYDKDLNINFVIDDINVSTIKNIDNLSISVISPDKEKEKQYTNIIAVNIVFQLVKYILKQIFPQPFIITSERTGISIFYRELDTRRSALVEALADTENKNINKDIIMLRSHVSRYPSPVSRNMQFIRDLFDYYQKSNISQDLKQYMASKVSKGTYLFDKINNQILYKIKQGRKVITLPIYNVSSSVKSLLMLDSYVNYVMQSGQVLIIDEPELNLHPDNQREVARFLAMLVSSGVRLLFTTHSDYIIKELNNLIMLKSLSEDARDYAIGQIKKETKTEYQSEMFLAKDKVTCIIAKQDGKLGRVKTQIAPINEFGIDIDIIDREINYIGETSDILSELVNVNHRSIGE
jgi:predicted ATPase